VTNAVCACDFCHGGYPQTRRPWFPSQFSKFAHPITFSIQNQRFSFKASDFRDLPVLSMSAWYCNVIFWSRSVPGKWFCLVIGIFPVTIPFSSNEEEFLLCGLRPLLLRFPTSFGLLALASLFLFLLMRLFLLVPLLCAARGLPPASAAASLLGGRVLLSVYGGPSLLGGGPPLLLAGADFLLLASARFFLGDQGEAPL
jgi:hypothetical protein